MLGAFAQSAEGDSSPNIDGERCEGTDEYCYYNTSTCPEDVQNVSISYECPCYGISSFEKNSN